MMEEDEQSGAVRNDYAAWWLWGSGAFMFSLVWIFVMSGVMPLFRNAPVYAKLFAIVVGTGIGTAAVFIEKNKREIARKRVFMLVCGCIAGTYFALQAIKLVSSGVELLDPDRAQFVENCAKGSRTEKYCGCLYREISKEYSHDQMTAAAIRWATLDFSQRDIVILARINKVCPSPR